MESQNIINLLDYKEKDHPKFQTKKLRITNDRNNGKYGGERGERDSTIKISTEVVKPFLADYSDTYILVTGNITVNL